MKTHDVAKIVFGYLTGISALHEIRHEIISLFKASIENQPAYSRLIYRPTFKYRKILGKSENSFEFPLTHEENIQLDRGDIPYFFQDLKSDKVFFFAEGKVVQEVLDPGLLSKKYCSFYKREVFLKLESAKSAMGSLGAADLVNFLLKNDSGGPESAHFYKDTSIIVKKDSVQILKNKFRVDLRLRNYHNNLKEE